MNETISVSAFVAILNETLLFAYPEVTIAGEVSGYKVNQNKWVFFDVKDEEASLPCFMPLFALKVPIEDGMTVRLTGSPKLLNWGKFSFTVRVLELAGAGELKRALELLKAKLQREGLFDPSRKRRLPAFPRRIGLITSVGSAAYHDFLKITNARWGGLEIVVADVVVQGQAAPDSVVAALNHLNQLPQTLDIIALVRGGGSLEDLAAFSTEPVVRAVAASRTPIVVGVGHEVDVGLADLAADLRAATPTDAARLIVPDRREVAGQVSHLEAALSLRLERRLSDSRHRLERAEAHLSRFIERPKQLVAQSIMQLSHRLEALIQQNQANVQALGRLLSGLDPTATLKRGYAIVRRGGEVVRRAAQVKSGDGLMIQLAQGEVEAEVQ